MNWKIFRKRDFNQNNVVLKNDIYISHLQNCIVTIHTKDVLFQCSIISKLGKNIFKENQFIKNTFQKSIIRIRKIRPLKDKAAADAQINLRTATASWLVLRHRISTYFESKLYCTKSQEYNSKKYAKVQKNERKIERIFHLFSIIQQFE